MCDSAKNTGHYPNHNPTNLLIQRLLAADRAWHEFVAAHHAYRFQEEPVHQNLIFLLFAKFVLELVNDNHLRTQLFEHFEPQFLPATAFRGEQDE